MLDGHEMVTGRLSLYRFFAVDDSLLYIGVTRTGLERVRGHASKSRWWSHVARATFEHGRTLDDERTAIELERPLFNVDHTDRSDWVDAINDAVANGWLTDREVIQREFDNLIRLRDRLDQQRAEIDRRLDVLRDADRTNRRLRRNRD